MVPSYWAELGAVPHAYTSPQWDSIGVLLFSMPITFHSHLRLSRLIFEFEGLDSKDSGRRFNWRFLEFSTFKVLIEFPDSSFMEIKHVREFDIQSLIGNSGGYLGLFTGYALLQLPGLIVLLQKCVSKILSRYYNTVT